MKETVLFGLLNIDTSLTEQHMKYIVSFQEIGRTQGISSISVLMWGCVTHTDTSHTRTSKY